MKERLHIDSVVCVRANRVWVCVGLFVVLCMLMSSCRNFSIDGWRIQRAVLSQERYAEEKTEDIIRVLQHGDMDSLMYYAQVDDNIIFSVYRGTEAVYWSSAWLNSSGLPVHRVFDRWVYREWNNAHGLCRRTRVGDFFVLTIIPLKYNYAITSDQLHNYFIPPFHGDEKWTLKARKGSGRDYYPIYSEDGSFLFSVCRLPAVVPENQISLPTNFSYQSVLTGESAQYGKSKGVLKVYFLLTLLLFVALISVGAFWLVRSRGFRNMKLGGKFQIILVSLMMVVFVSNFVLSVLYIRKMFSIRQKTTLQQKAQYIQNTLQNMYFWDMELTPLNTMALNIDLRDMSYAYETDIHVYDINGQLVGSSTPQLFELGLLSRYVAPEPVFGASPMLVKYEQLGDVRYLTAYTEFVNGNYTRLGYIALPYFISQDQVDADVDSYVVWLLPLYVVLLLLTIFVIWLISRILSSSLGAISSQMQHYRLGERGAHIDYFFHDEVGDLVHHYNEMMDALSASTQRLARAEREDAWRTMARQVAHEINNPLTPMKLTLQQLQRLKGTDRFDSYFDSSTQLLIDQVDNLSHIAQSFSSFAKMPEVNPTEVDVAQKLSSCIALLSNNPDCVLLRYIGPDHGVKVITDGEQITQVFTNIVRNATQAMVGMKDGDVIIILKELPLDQRELKGLDVQSEWVEISFSDNGPGIAADIRDKVFMPNFTTKNTGAGLGLAISKNIVEGSGGKICFQTSEKGTTFFVYLRKKV